MHLSRLAHTHGTEICNSLPEYHAFTACDTTSAFYGKGKKRSFEILIKDHTIQADMAELGVASECSLDTQKSCNLLVCRLYGQQNCTSINEARYKIFCAMAPACQNLTQQPIPGHCTSNGPTTTPTFGNMLSKPFLPSEVVMDTVGFCMDKEKIEIKWMSQPTVPDAILQVLNCRCKTGCNSNRCGCFRNELKCTEICRCENCSNCDRGEDDSMQCCRYL